MIEIFFQILSLLNSILAFITVIIFARSNIKFTKGELQEIINYFVWGTIFMFGGMIAQLEVEFLNLAGTPIDMIKYFLFLGGFSYYLLASFKIHKMSKVLGFASGEMPKKLKKILKS
ncbi:MAG: hypothetical protein QXR09_01380 [Candidatus Aenigmatarchaeota archaeon]